MTSETPLINLETATNCGEIPAGGFRGLDGRHYDSKERLREADLIWLENYKITNLNQAQPVRGGRGVVYEPSDAFPPTYYLIFL